MHDILCIRFLFQLFICCLVFAATCLHLFSAVSYAENKPSQTSIYNDNLMKLKMNRVFHSDIYLKTHFETHFVFFYTAIDRLTQKLVFF